MNRCARCEEVFVKWSEYHAHHVRAQCARKLRPVNTSGRQAAKIIQEAEMSWLKPFLISGMVLMLAGVGYAGPCNPGNAAFCNIEGPQGPQGPAGLDGADGADGLNGTDGLNGLDGINGADGKDGLDGRNGKDASLRVESKLLLDTAIRLYDGKYLQVQAFNAFSIGRHRGYDLLRDGKNMFYGARVVFKLGSSYEERELQKLRKEIEALRTLSIR